MPVIRDGLSFMPTQQTDRGSPLLGRRFQSCTRQKHHQALTRWYTWSVRGERPKSEASPEAHLAFPLAAAILFHPGGFSFEVAQLSIWAVELGEVRRQESIDSNQSTKSEKRIV